MTGTRYSARITVGVDLIADTEPAARQVCADLRWDIERALEAAHLPGCDTDPEVTDIELESNT